MVGFIRQARARRRHLRRSHGSVGELWAEALPYEVQWWAHRMELWPPKFQQRCDPAFPLQDEIADLLDAAPGSTVRLLDAGAGPVTVLGKVHPRWKLEITAVDVLADEYNRLLAQNGIEPPVRTLQCENERLSEMFPNDTFDLGFAKNTLDHSYDPVRAIRELVICVKPGAPVVLKHARNVAEKEAYLGLHQWNFDLDGRDLVVWRHRNRTVIADAISDLAVVESVRQGPAEDEHRMLTAVVRKISPVSR